MSPEEVKTPRTKVIGSVLCSGPTSFALGRRSGRGEGWLAMWGQEGKIVIPEDLNKQVIKIKVLRRLRRF